MADAESRILLEEDGQTIRIGTLSVLDGNAHALLASQKEDLRPELVRRALKLGFFAISRMAMGGDVDYVEKEFNRLLIELDLRLNPDDTSSHLGRLRKLIEQYFEEGGTLEKLFNPQNEQSPLGIVQKEIKDEIQKLRDLIIGEEAKKEVWERTAIKGRDFEDACEELLGAVVIEWLGDELMRTTDEVGRIEGSRVGDFTITLSDSQDRIVIEVKDRQRISLPAILDELDEAMENRGAKYAIFVSKYVEALPKKVGWFNEYRNNKLICALGSRQGDTFFPRLLWVVCQWAKLRVLEVRGRLEGFDSAIVSGHLENSIHHLDELQNVYVKCDTATDAIEDVRRTVHRTERDIKSELEGVITQLKLAIEV